jgi:histidinol-phosphatase
VAVVPAQNLIFWATSGGGAFEAALGGPPRRIGVAGGRNELTGSRLAVFAYAPMIAAPLTAIVPDLPWRFHPALLVARGDLDLAVQTGGQVWDFAATSLIVEEAGGRYSGLDGRREPAAGPSLYSSGPLLHEQALGLMRGGEWVRARGCG